MREIETCDSVKRVLEDLSDGSKKQFKTALIQYLQFRNNKEGLTSEINPDILIEEARENIDFTQRQIDNFYLWMQGKKIESYGRGFIFLKSGEKKPIQVKSSTAFTRAYSNLRGFYVNNDIAFKRKWKKRIPKPKTKEAIKKDELYVFYKVDEKKKEIYFDRELMRQFLSNLKIRDQAITLALLSSAQDTGDLFKLNIGDITEQNINNRIYWKNTRSKTGVLFKTFFSKEATKLIRRYIDQEREDAKDEEPLFVIPGDKRMKPVHLSSIFRDAAKKMGVKWGDGEHNPLRPKRMRHLFRTACDTVGVSELYTNMFMGHKNSIGMAYSEVSKGKAELEYLRVEPFLTVYGEVEETTEIKKEISNLGTTVETLTKKNVALNDQINYMIHSLAEKEAQRKVNDEQNTKKIEELSKELNVEKSERKKMEKYYPILDILFKYPRFKEVIADILEKEKREGK